MAINGESIRPENDTWLDKEKLKQLADELLFEDRLQNRLEYLYRKHGQTNGLEMFRIIISRLEELQRCFDRELASELRHGGTGEILPDGEEKRYTMADLRDCNGFPVFYWLPQIFSKTTKSHITWNKVNVVKVEIINFVEGKQLEIAIKEAERATVEARVILTSIGETNKKQICISPENIESICSALAPYFQGQEAELRKLLEGKEIEGKVRFNESAKVLCNTFNTLHEAGRIGATIDQIKVWICKYFQANRKPYDLTEGSSTLNRYFQEKIEMEGQVLLPTIKGLITFSKS